MIKRLDSGDASLRASVADLELKLARHETRVTEIAGENTALKLTGNPSPAVLTGSCGRTGAGRVARARVRRARRLSGRRERRRGMASALCLDSQAGNTGSSVDGA